jgi:hypothetical protein
MNCTSKLAQIVGFATAIGCNAAVAQTRGAAGPEQQRSAITEIACPRGTQILVLLQSASSPAYVSVDEMPTTGQGDAKRLDARTVTPQDMPNTLEFTQVIGEKDVFIFVRDRAPNVNYPNDFQSHLEGYIGCGEWQARVLGGQPNDFLLKRTAPVQPAPQTGVASAPNAAPAPVPNAAPAPVPNAAPAPGPRQNERRAARGDEAQDQRAGEEGNAPRIAAELRSLGLLGIWSSSCDNRRAFFRDIYIFVDQSGRPFWRLYVSGSPDPDRFKREIINFQRLSANRFQLTVRGRYSDEEENAIITSRYRMENNQLFAEDIRTASGQVNTEKGRFASGPRRGQAVPGLVKCRVPGFGAPQKN